MRLARRGEPITFASNGSGPPDPAAIETTIPGEWVTAAMVAESVDRRGLVVIGARIPGPIDLSNSRLDAPLALRACQIEGTVHLEYAQAVSLDFSDSHFRPERVGDHAINARYAEIRGDVILDRVDAAALIDIQGAQIGGVLSGDEVTLEASPDALQGLGASVVGGVRFRNAQITGRFNLDGSYVEQGVDCHDATFNAGQPDLDAINLLRSHITGDVYLVGEFSAVGSIRLDSAEVAGQLVMDGAAIKAEGLAVSARAAVITGQVFLRNGFKATGAVTLNGAQLGQNLDLRGASIVADRSERAIDLRRAEIKEVLGWDPDLVQGVVDLKGCHVGTLDDQLGSWTHPGMTYRLRGFSYARFGSGGRWKCDDRRDWLTDERHEDAASMSPYRHLAVVYRRDHRDAEADAILIAGNHHASGAARRLLLGATIGYGYRPWRPLYLLAVAMVALSIVVALNQGKFTATSPRDGTSPNAESCTGEYPCLLPPIYVADVLVPLVDLEQEQFWVPDMDRPWGRVLFVVLMSAKVYGWLAAGLAAASFSNIVRRGRE